MRCHGDRESYFIVGEETVEIPSYSEILKHMSNGSGSVAAHSVAVATAAAVTTAVGTATVSAAAAAQPSVHGDQESKYKFGWISERTKKENPPADELIPKVVALGACMNDPLNCHQPAQLAASRDATITAGYTYLGQFLAHEITFDKEQLPNPQSLRSPQIDLDSLYGRGPQQDPDLFQDDHMRLKVAATDTIPNLGRSFENDLPRIEEGEHKGQAQIGDPRNDENLVIAQMHVAFCKFHNKVVDDLENRFPEASEAELFARAREEVVKYFQWIILYDYLPTLVGQAVVTRTLQEGLERYRFEKSDDLFIPLEFSVAAFRIGHSMVRDTYEWNRYHPSVKVNDLFGQTRHSGQMTKLSSDWVIDWRRFFNFQDFAYKPVASINKAMQIDTSFGLHIENISDYPHKVSDRHLQAITIRNLIRSYELGVPCGEEMETSLKVEHKLSSEDLRGTEQKHVLADPFFADRTPLWYYVLREAEIVRDKEGVTQLGEVGGRIVAGTLIEIIRHSPASILRDADWQPTFGRPVVGDGPRRFYITDLLHTADVVAPIAQHQNYFGEP